MYREIIGGAKCIVAHPTKILGGRPTLRSIGSAVTSLSGVRGGAPNAVAFCCIACSQNASGCNNVIVLRSALQLVAKSFKLAK